MFRNKLSIACQSIQCSENSTIKLNLIIHNIEPRHVTEPKNRMIATIFYTTSLSRRILNSGVAYAKGCGKPHSGDYRPI